MQTIILAALTFPQSEQDDRLDGGSGGSGRDRGRPRGPQALAQRLRTDGQQTQGAALAAAARGLHHGDHWDGGGVGGGGRGGEDGEGLRDTNV